MNWRSRVADSAAVAGPLHQAGPREHVGRPAPAVVLLAVCLVVEDAVEAAGGVAEKRLAGAVAREVADAFGGADTNPGSSSLQMAAAGAWSAARADHGERTPISTAIAMNRRIAESSCRPHNAAGGRPARRETVRNAHPARSGRGVKRQGRPHDPSARFSARALLKPSRRHAILERASRIPRRHKP